MSSKDQNYLQNLQKETFFKDQEQTKAWKGWKKWFLVVLAIISGVYIFIPEFTDAFPFLGWLDEGIALIILTYSLNKLGIRIPLLNRILSSKTKK